MLILSLTFRLISELLTLITLRFIKAEHVMFYWAFFSYWQLHNILKTRLFEEPSLFFHIQDLMKNSSKTAVKDNLGIEKL